MHNKLFITRNGSNIDAYKTLTAIGIAGNFTTYTQ